VTQFSMVHSPGLPASNSRVPIDRRRTPSLRSESGFPPEAASVIVHRPSRPAPRSIQRICRQPGQATFFFFDGRSEPFSFPSDTEQSLFPQRSPASGTAFPPFFTARAENGLHKGSSNGLSLSLLQGFVRHGQRLGLTCEGVSPHLKAPAPRCPAQTAPWYRRWREPATRPKCRPHT